MEMSISVDVGQRGESRSASVRRIALAALSASGARLLSEGEAARTDGSALSLWVSWPSGDDVAAVPLGRWEFPSVEALHGAVTTLKPHKLGLRLCEQSLRTAPLDGELPRAARALLRQ